MYHDFIKAKLVGYILAASLLGYLGGMVVNAREKPMLVGYGCGGAGPIFAEEEDSFPPSGCREIRRVD